MRSIADANVPDAWLAALAQAHDCEMVTFDRGFRTFSKLKLRLLEPAG